MHEDIEKNDRTRLLEAASALIAQGNAKFSVAALCQEAGLDREAFRAHFRGRAELMAALDQAAAAAHAPTSEEPAHEEPAPAPVTLQAAVPARAVAAESGAGDAWLERRLRVFERALTALEARADATTREHARSIAQLEEKVRVLTGEAVGAEAVQEFVEGRTLRVANGGSVTVGAIGAPDLEAAISAAPAAPLEIPDASPDIDEAAAEEARARNAQLVLPLETPPQEKAVPREEMAELLEGARRAARCTAGDEKPKKARAKWRLRWLALGCMSLVGLFVCVGLALDEPARAVQLPSGSGVSYRHVSQDAFERMAALADNGNARAQAGMALAYLRGEKVNADPRAALHWAGQAAKAGDPMGQYLMGVLYHQGGTVKADPALALRWFAAAARRGNIKAMHNLAIAYAEGLGTEKNSAQAATWFARAAERGYVDSAFDLAVLYERGDGVAQDAVQALKWYSIAAVSGDAPSQARADVLRHQMAAKQIALADAQAREFERLSPLASANALPGF